MKEDIKIYLNKSSIDLIRLEYCTFLAITLYFIFEKLNEINWILFIALFAIIDLIGYIPGLIRTKAINSEFPEKIYYLLYNLTHNLTVVALLILAAWKLDFLNWSLLAIPLHLFGDRGLFGNFYKPYKTPYNSPSVAK